MWNRCLLIAVLGMGVWAGNVQAGPDSLRGDTLTLYDAVSRALRANHDIQVARNEARIDANNATPGNAGYLPRIGVTGSYQHAVKNVRAEFAGNNPDRSKDGSVSKRYSTSAYLSYTIFDGFGNRYRLKRLERVEDLSAAESRLQIEQTLIDVVQRYLQIIANRRLVDINRETMQLSAERYKRARLQFQQGGSNRVELLNAEVALNQDSVRYIQAESDLRRAKRDLLVLLGDSPSQSINISPKIQVNDKLELPSLMNAALGGNATVEAARQRVLQSKWALKETKSRIYPSVQVSAAYEFARSEDEVSVMTFQRSHGFAGGISLQFNLFDGFRQSIDEQNDQLRYENSRRRHEQLRNEIEKSVMNTYEVYQTNLLLLEKQQLDVKTAALNFTRTRESFELGQITNTQFREAQLNLLNARRQLVERRINAKISEIGLLQLAGRLIKTGSVHTAVYGN